MSYLFPFHATDIMSSDPITVEMNEDVKHAITLMIKYDISGLPVINKSKLVGVITKSDIKNNTSSIMKYLFYNQYRFFRFM